MMYAIFCNCCFVEKRNIWKKKTTTNQNFKQNKGQLFSHSPFAKNVI